MKRKKEVVDEQDSEDESQAKQARQGQAPGSPSGSGSHSGGEGAEDSEGADDEEDSGGDIPLLTEAQIAGMSRDELQTAFNTRDGGFGLQTGDMPDIRFRIDALDLLSPADWIKTPLCAGLILPWLRQHPNLVPDLIIRITQRQTALSAPVAALTAQQRQEVWAAVNAGAQVSVSARRDGCEYLAHAICEVIADQFADIARMRLTKVWLVAPDLRLHPPDNWRHHVAPMLDCVDGMYVVDLCLAPTGPITKAEWLSRARGTASAAGVFNCVRPWELIGTPITGQDTFELETYIPLDDAAPQIQQCKRTTTTTT